MGGRLPNIEGVVRDVGWGHGLLCTDDLASFEGYLLRRTGFSAFDLLEGHLANAAMATSIRSGSGTRRSHILVRGLCEGIGGGPSWGHPGFTAAELDLAIAHCLARMNEVLSAVGESAAVTFHVPSWGLEVAHGIAERLELRLFNHTCEMPGGPASKQTMARSVGAIAVPTRRFSWRVAKSEINLVFGDIFEMKSAARVSSEQTDFVLSIDTDTISGRLGAVGGDKLRRELRARAEAEGRRLGVSPDDLPVPTVLRTEEKRTGLWFHAGIHAPSQRHVAPSPADDLRAVEYCVDEVLRQTSRADRLNRTKAVRLEAVAFPLIGTGKYGISPRLVASVMIRSIVQSLAREPNAPRSVTLVLPPTDGGMDAFEAAVQALLDSNGDATMRPSLGLGLALTEGLEARMCRASDAGYRAWLLCCLAEHLTIYMYAVLESHRARETSFAPLLEPDWKASFGAVVKRLREAVDRSTMTSTGPGDSLSYWADHIERVAREQRNAFDQLVTIRNDVAHRCKEASEPEVLSLLRRVIGYDRWSELVERVPPPQEELAPWIEGTPATRVLSCLAGGVPRYIDTL